MTHLPPRMSVFPYTTLFRSYVAKYVNKKSDMDLAAKGLGAKEWNNSLKTKLSLLPKKLFRIRMSRNFGMKMRLILILDRKSGSAGMPRPISYAVFCLKKKKKTRSTEHTKGHRETNAFTPVSTA